MGIVAALRDFFSAPFPDPWNPPHISEYIWRGARSLKVTNLGDLQRLELKPGDRFVLKCDYAITPEISARIYEQWEKFMGDSKLLVIDKSMDIGVINLGNEEKKDA